jgi:hypothetical protein
MFCFYKLLFVCAVILPVRLAVVDGGLLVTARIPDGNLLRTLTEPCPVKVRDDTTKKR